MRAASQLPGRGPTEVDIVPWTCTLIKNPMVIKKINLYNWVIYDYGVESVKIF